MKNEEIKKALIDLVKVCPISIECENMNHTKADQHRFDETCPVVVRYTEALDNARKLLK